MPAGLDSVNKVTESRTHRASVLFGSDAAGHMAIIAAYVEQQVHTAVDISTTSDDRTMLQLLKYA